MVIHVRRLQCIIGNFVKKRTKSIKEIKAIKKKNELQLELANRPLKIVQI